MCILVLPDQFSPFTWAHHIHHKSDVPRAFKRFPAVVRGEGEDITLRTDAEGEFMGNSFAATCDRDRIRRGFTNTNVDALNGMVK